MLSELARLADLMQSWRERRMEGECPFGRILCSPKPERAGGKERRQENPRKV